MSPREILQQYWGHANFRPLQEDIIQAVLHGHDVLALLPTGGGKSICYQVPALMRPGISIVVSPLIALIKDQVDQLQQRNIAAAAIHAGMAPQQIDSTLDNCIYGQTKLLYLSPERLQTDLLQERVRKMNVSLLAVDEAHCISQWGYDFRPAYLAIADFKPLIPKANTIALTATATATVQQDIQDKLHLRQATHFQQSFARHNLTYVVRKTEDKDRQLLKILHNVPGTAIIYVNTRKKTNTVAQWLQHKGISAVAYNAGLTTAERTTRQEAWMQGTTTAIVATNAFGMGIDKADVRLVIHLDLPNTLEAYYQEAGRAGRDQQKAYTILLYADHDITHLRENVQTAHPTPQQLKKTYQHLANYYQIAIGSHAMTTHDFDLEAFAHTYGLPVPATYQALKTLEAEGLLQLSQAFSQPSQVHITTSPRQLYAFQVAQAPHDPLIKTLLRLYGGEQFAAPCTISEQHIARQLNTHPQNVRKQLQTLHQQQILHYYPQKDQPQLTFTTARHPAHALPLDAAKLQQRATTATDKAEAVIRYATHQHRCRPQQLLEYFGEVNHQPCGQCDVCLRKKHPDTPDQDHQRHRNAILQRLQAGINDLNAIVDSMDWTAEKAILSTVRQMLENKELAYDDEGKLTHTTTQAP